MKSFETREEKLKKGGQRANELLEKLTPAAPLDAGPAYKKETKPVPRGRGKLKSVNGKVVKAGGVGKATLPALQTSATGSQELPKPIVKPVTKEGRENALIKKRDKKSLTSRASHKAIDLNETDEQKFEDAREKRKKGKTLFDNPLVDSKAFKDLWPLAAKVLVWFQQKLVRRQDKNERWKVIDTPLSFTFKEAEWRGISSHHQFSKCLKELHAKGFIDIVRPGSAREGDYTQFKMSDRWKDFGTVAFKTPLYPKSVHWVNYGYGSDKKTRKSEI